ncbi:MAG: hypothetical protein AB7C90_02345 [Bacteroidales bacterium]
MKKKSKNSKKSLFEQYEEICKKAREELEKLPKEEQEKRLCGQRSLQKKWDAQPWY